MRKSFAVSRPVVVDLFCGAGGFSLGFLESGFKVVVGVDCDRAAALTYKANIWTSTVLVEDIKNIESSLLERIAGEDITVVIGSPPCEPFTGANPKRYPNPLDRLYKDPIGRLVLEFIRIVGDLQPKVFVMENVPAIMDGELKHALRREFKRIGYQVYFNVLRAEDYGTPSHRVRVFISNIKISPRKHKERINVAKALRGLPEPGDHSIPNHDPVPVPERKLRRIAKLKWGKSLIMYEGANGRRLPNLIRLDPRTIAPTVLGCSRFIHPYEPRFLTVREQARLMGFPDDFVFMGGRDEQFNQVGEAVPVPLSRAIATFIYENIEQTR